MSSAVSIQLHNAGSSLNHTQRSLALLLQISFSVGGVVVFPSLYLTIPLLQYQDSQGGPTFQGPNMGGIGPACLISEGRCILELRTDQQEQNAWTNYLVIDPTATLKISSD